MSYSIFRVLNMLFSLLEFAIIIDCISSWMPQFQDNKFIRLIHDFIYPLLEPLKRLQDKLMPGLPMDFSPIIAFALLNMIRKILSESLF
jgi:YggT family protein